jgi:hypothetical protein
MNAQLMADFLYEKEAGGLIYYDTGKFAISLN